MAPTESVFWEAKPKVLSCKDTRRPSTTVDASGCIISRGFVIPSRASSFDSVAAQSTTSSMETVDSPVSPAKETPPGFRWPITHQESRPRPSVASSHRTSRSTGSLEMGAAVAERPRLADRRDTWQGPYSSGTSSRWNDHELAEATCGPSPPACGTVRPLPPITCNSRTKKPLHSMRRVKSEKVDLKALEKKNAGRKPKREGKKQSTNAEHGKSEGITELTTGSAIASDSEEEDSATRFSSRPSLRSSRVTYADRRARNDAPNEYCLPTAPVRPVEAMTACQIQDDSAIVSDDDSDEDNNARDKDALASVLSLAKLHRSRNSETARLDGEEQEPIQRSTSVAKVRLSRAAASTDYHETLTRVQSYEPEASLVSQRELRPSRSRPRPSKGVLKSRSQSRRRMSHSGKQAPHTTMEEIMGERVKLPLDELAVRFAPAA